MGLWGCGRGWGGEQGRAAGGAAVVTGGDAGAAAEGDKGEDMTRGGAEGQGQGETSERAANEGTCSYFPREFLCAHALAQTQLLVPDSGKAGSHHDPKSTRPSRSRPSLRATPRPLCRPMRRQKRRSLFLRPRRIRRRPLPSSRHTRRSLRRHQKPGVRRGRSKRSGSRLERGWTASTMMRGG